MNLFSSRSIICPLLPYVGTRYLQTVARFSNHVVRSGFGAVCPSNLSVSSSHFLIPHTVYRTHALTVYAAGYTSRHGRCHSILNHGSTTKDAPPKASSQTSLCSTWLAFPATSSVRASSYTRPSYAHNTLFATLSRQSPQSASMTSPLACMLGSSV